jgi:hypothetical protein
VRVRVRVKVWVRVRVRVKVWVRVRAKLWMREVVDIYFTLTRPPTPTPTRRFSAGYSDIGTVITVQSDCMSTSYLK